MLQLEHEKAQKKIQETAKKTDELINLRKRNDERFMRVSSPVHLPVWTNSNSRPLQDQSLIDDCAFKLRDLVVNDDVALCLCLTAINGGPVEGRAKAHGRIIGF